MTEDERRIVGETRRAVFQNVANGLPQERVMEVMRMSQVEVERAVKAVARKITEWLVYARQPPIACDNVGLIRLNRKRLLAVLTKIGDLSLGSDFILFPDRKTGELIKVQFGKIMTQAMDHPEMIDGASRRMAEAYR
jgi:hypothetical protein